MSKKTPLVSVPMLTFNHEKYIAQAIESVLKQKTDFPFELVVGEDCSTDGTRVIVESYARRYPEQVKIVTSAANVGALENNIRTTKACRGKYLAILEGDDFWNDELKLQKQVDFLENNPEYGLIHSDVNQLHNDSNVIVKNYNAINKQSIPEGNIFEDLLDPERYIIKTPTVVFHRELFEHHVDYEIIRERGWVIADLFTWLSLARFTKVKYFHEAMATYRVLRNSASNMEDFRKKLSLHKSVYEIRLYFIDKYGCPKNLEKKVKKFYVTTIAYDALKLKDGNLLKWIKKYSRKNKINLGMKNKALILKTTLGNCLKSKKNSTEV